MIMKHPEVDTGRKSAVRFSGIESEDAGKRRRAEEAFEESVEDGLLLCCVHTGPVAQFWLERTPDKREVIGSSPIRPTS